MTKHYVEFFYPGVFISETSTKEISNRDAKINLPKGAYGYRIFSREEVVLDGETLYGERKNYSGITYYGKILTLDDVKELEPKDHYEILISNMEINKYDKVVRTICGNFQPLDKNDVVVEREIK